MKEIIAWYVAGLILLLAEIYLPGMIAGITGGIFMLLAAFLGYQRYGGTVGTLILTSEVVIGLLIFIFWIKFFPKSSMGRKMALKADAPAQTSAPEIPENLIGKEGTTVTFLRPSGVALIEGVRRDVIAEGIFIEPNQQVRVVNIEGCRIIVRKS